jgi:AcrR family transcriptional regulator
MPKISAATVAEHRLRTRDLLLDAIESLVLERSFESISMRDVAERAGVARTAIYNYAPDTVALLTEATKRGSAEVRAAIAVHADDTSLAPSQRLRAIVTALLRDHARSTSTLLTVIAIERNFSEERLVEALASFRAEIAVDLVGVIRAGVEAGEFTAFADPEMLLPLMVGVMQFALHKIADTAPGSGDMAEVAAQFLVNALSGA